MDLSCSNNMLTSLNIKNNPDLMNLACDHNKLKSLDISKNPTLLYLDCSYNYLDISSSSSFMNSVYLLYQNGAYVYYSPQNKVKTAAPSAPASKTGTGSYKITLTAPAGTTLYYTTNGKTPSTNLTTKIDPGKSKTLTISKTTTVKVIAHKPGNAVSDTVSRTYTVKTSSPTTTNLPANKTFSGSTKITLKAPSGAALYYTTNGKTPTTSSTKIAAGTSKTITLSKTTTVKAMAVKTGCKASNVITRKYTKK